MRKTLYLVLAGSLLVMSACSKGPNAAVEDVDQAIAASAEGDFEAAVAEGNAHWDNRDSEEETRAAIEAWERAVTYDTGDTDRREALYPVYQKLARAWYWLAHGHLYKIEAKRERESQQQEAYANGMEYGKLAIATRNDEWNASLNAGNDIVDAVEHLEEEDVPAAYWYASNAGRWATIEGLSALLGFKDRLFAIMTTCDEMAPTFFFNATDRYFGVYYTKVPFMNPDLDQSYERFMSAIEANPQYLESRVLLAEEWATKSRERDIAIEHLETVLEFDLSEAPEIQPENARSQARAEHILNNLDEFYR
jgi:hypothetical protein